MRFLPKHHSGSQDISLILMAALFVMFVIKLLTAPFGALALVASISWLDDLHITVMFALFIGFSVGIFLIHAIGIDRKNLRSLLDNLSIGIIRYDSQGKWKDANDTARAILPRNFFEDRKAHDFHSFLNFLWERSLESHNTHILHDADTAPEQFIQEVIALDTDRIGHVRIQKSVLGDTHVMITDITDLQETMGLVNHLEQENASLEEGLHHTADSVFISEYREKMWEIVFANAAFHALHEARSLDDFLELYPPAYPLDVLAHIRESSSSLVYDAERKNKSGTVDYFTIHIDRFQVDKAQRMIVFIRNVTVLKQKEMQLRQSLKLEAIGRLAGGVAHDFNNILSVIQGYGRILERYINDSTAKDSLDRIMHATRRAMGITSQLLTFGHHHITTDQSTDAARFIQTSEAFLSTLLTSRIEMSLSIHVSSAWVGLSEECLTQILMNLIVNAKDAMPDGGCVIIELDRVMHNGSAHIRLNVQDTGHGIPEDIKASIFDPFFTTKETGKGNGLGLAIIHGLVTQGGGEVICKSEASKGACFTLLMPEVTPPVLAARQDSPVSGQSFPTGEHILLAEDEDDLRALIKFYLEEKGYDVEAVKDGYEALAYLEDTSKKVHHLITDIVMPRLDGAKLAGLVREVYPTINILCMSGYPQSRDDLVKETPEDILFLAKPIDPEILYGIIRDKSKETNTAQWAQH